MLSDSAHLKLAIAVSAILHVVFLGLAHLAEPSEHVSALPETLRRVATVQIEPLSADEESLDGHPVAFVFDQPSAQPDEPEAPEEEPPPVEESTPEEPEPEPEQAEFDKPEPQDEPEPEDEIEPDPAPSAPASDMAPVVTSTAEDAPRIKPSTEADSAAQKVLASTVEGQKRAQRKGRDHMGGGPPRDGASAMNSRHAHAEQKKLNRQYGRTLFTRVNAAKTYPMIARRAGLEGRLLVAITVDRHGKLIAVEIRESSGHSTLDDNALATIRGLGQFPLPPNGLSWAQKTFVLPMNYSLQ